MAERRKEVTTREVASITFGFFTDDEVGGRGEPSIV